MYIFGKDCPHQTENFDVRDAFLTSNVKVKLLSPQIFIVDALSEGLAHPLFIILSDNFLLYFSQVYIRQLSVKLQSGALIFISELPGVKLLFRNTELHRCIYSPVSKLLLRVSTQTQPFYFPTIFKCFINFMFDFSGGFS